MSVMMIVRIVYKGLGAFCLVVENVSLGETITAYSLCVFLQ